MTIFQAFILGVVQGMTEFLPVSSSGHLIFIPRFLGWADQGITFDVFIHIGTLIAVIFFFRKRLLGIVKSLFHFKSKTTIDQQNRRLLGLLILTTIPGILVGLFFSDFIEAHLRLAFVVGIDMIFWGVILALAEWYNKKQEQKNKTDLSSVNIKHATLMGIAQALAAIFSGTSRSGITMTAGMFSGLSKPIAAEFSFLMSIPIIALAGLDDLLNIFKNGAGAVEWGPYLVGFFAALVSGFLALKLLLKMIEKWSLKPFVIYRIIIGILILTLL